MILSSYLLFADKLETILDVFTSSYGRRMVDDALDDLCVLQDYASNRQNIFKYTLNVDEISDIAYSYYKYKQTGVCAHHIYAPPEQELNRFGDPSENFSGNYRYTKFDKFNMQNVWQISQMGEGEFPVEEEFNDFAKQWVKNSTTLRNIRSIQALGYNTEHEFGYYKNVSPSDVNPKTLLLLQKLLNFVSKPDLFESSTTRVEYTIKAVQEFLAIPKETRVIFDYTYNRLNHKPSKDDVNYNYQGVLYDKMVQVLRELGSSKANLNHQLAHILHDCNVIFSARFKNNTSNKETYKSAESFLENIPKDVINRYGELSNEAKEFVRALYRSSGKAAVDMPRSTLAILELYLIFQQFSVEVVNMLLELDFTSEDYMLASKELYKVFSIPFYFGDSTADLTMTILNGYGLSEEEDKFDKPQPQLIEFAYIAARSALSKAMRLSIGGVR